MRQIDIITGVTGFLGRHFLTRLLDANDSTVVAMVRGGDQAEARARLAESVDVDEVRCQVEVGDVVLPDCGLVQQRIEQIAAVEQRKQFWHLAASLNWEPGKREHIQRTNVEGTRHALQLAQRVGVGHFYYVSTAYTCGGMEGVIPEQIHGPQTPLNNEYERSKQQAERLVVEFCTRAGMGHTILRPAIIVGDSRSYTAVGSTTGLYGFIRELRRFGRRLGDSTARTRFYARQDARLAFIPIDHVVDGMMHVRGMAEKASIVHLTPAIDERSATLGEALDYLIESLRLSDRIAVHAASLEGLSTLERMFERRLEFYNTYMRSSKTFASSLPPSYRKTLPFSQLRRFIDAELEHREPEHAH